MMMKKKKDVSATQCEISNEFGGFWLLMHLAKWILDKEISSAAGREK